MKLVVPVVAMAVFALVSCASSPGGSGGASQSTESSASTSSTPSTSTTTTAPEFVGYVWRLTHVSGGGLSFDVHPLNPRDLPRIQFTSDGQYGASDGINYTSGSYTLTTAGFNSNDGASTLALYAGKDRDQLAVIDAIGDLVAKIPVTVSSAGEPNTIIMRVKAYVLTFRRVGAAITYPADPSTTGPVPSIAYGTPPNCDVSTAPGNVPCPGDSIGPT